MSGSKQMSDHHHSDRQVNIERGKERCELMRKGYNEMMQGQLQPHGERDRGNERLKIPKSQTKVVNADEMLQLQLEAVAKYYIEFITVKEEEMLTTSDLLKTCEKASRKDSSASSDLIQLSLDNSCQSDSTQAHSPTPLATVNGQQNSDELHANS